MDNRRYLEFDTIHFSTKTDEIKNLVKQSIKIMEFNIRTHIELSKVFTIEADTPEEAMELAQKMMLEDTDFNALEVDQIGFDLTDPSIRKYNIEYCKKKIKEAKEKQGSFDK